MISSMRDRTLTQSGHREMGEREREREKLRKFNRNTFVI